TETDVRTALALFITSATRGATPPELALGFQGVRPLPTGLPELLDGLLSDLRHVSSGTLGNLVQIAADAWRRLRIGAGTAPWTRAAAHLTSLARPIVSQAADDESIRLLQAIVERSRMEALVDLDWSQAGSVSLMNFHQTKGREADAVILVYRPGDYLANRATREPFEEASRLLYVAMTRARERVVVVLPPEPHALVAPFEDLVMINAK
ncbi:MAG: 3'-5' exonuclease, partial [Dehalococcoidia bacterium]